MLYCDRFDIPNIDFFQNENIFTGSLKGFRYKLEPDSENIKCMIWWGDNCFEKSEIEKEQCFPLNAQGLKELAEWMDQQYHAKQEL